MSQQEFFPSPQSSKRDELADAEIAPQRPISWSSKFKTGDVTKNEHPSTYEEESLPPYSYAAQDRRSTASERATQGAQPRMSPNTTTTNTRQRTQQSFSPDGDAMEYGYRPPRSTTTQARRSLRKAKNTVLRVVTLVLCLILLLKLLPFLATIFVTLLGIGLFLIILPILIVLAFVIIFGGLVLLLLSRLGFPIGRNLFGRHRWHNGWRWRW